MIAAIRGGGKKRGKKDDIKVGKPENTTHESGFKLDPKTGNFVMEGEIPPEFQAQITAMFKERNETGKFMRNHEKRRDESQDRQIEDDDDGPPVVRRQKSGNGPTVSKGLSTTEILAKMRELCLAGNPWDFYTCVRESLGPVDASYRLCCFLVFFSIVTVFGPQNIQYYGITFNLNKLKPPFLLGRPQLFTTEIGWGLHAI